MKAEKFIRRAIEKHGDLYSYLLVTDTVNIKDFYQIICPVHGIFKQRGDSHLQGAGCGKCKKSILKTGDEFIDEAKILYDNFYNYESVNYIGCKTKVDIICPIHGIFQQSPDSHLAGHGCVLCAFDINSQKMKDIITCPIHGDFNQTPNQHLCGKGCAKCGVRTVHSK